MYLCEYCNRNEAGYIVYSDPGGENYQEMFVCYRCVDRIEGDLRVTHPEVYVDQIKHVV